MKCLDLLFNISKYPTLYFWLFSPRVRAQPYIKTESLPLADSWWNMQPNLFSSFWFFFHEHSRFTGQQGKEKDVYLTALHHFHPFHRHVDINQAITARSTPLHIASSQIQTGKLWFPSASC